MTKKIPAKKTVVSKKTVKKPVKSVVSKTKTSAKAKVSVSKNSPKKTATKSKITKKTKSPIVKSTTKKALVKKKASTVKTKVAKVSKPIKKKSTATKSVKAAPKTSNKKPTTTKNKLVSKPVKAKVKPVVEKKTKKVVEDKKVVKLVTTKDVLDAKKERKNTKKTVLTIPVPKPIASNLPPDKRPKVKNILISQPFPENGKSPFLDIASKWKVKVDFRTFIKVEGLSAKEFRRLKIYITDYSAIIFNSRNAIDYFFKLCEEMRVKLSQEMKYFCTSEAIALYLQKYIQYRKRKVFYDQPGRTLFDLINRFKDTEKFLYPCSRDRKDDIPNYLRDKKVNYAEAYIYQTIPSDLSDLRNIKYDMIVFFSPIGIKSLFHNYPDFIQDDRRIGGFGQVTWDAIADAGLRLDIVAPSPAAASMAQAIENYLKESNK